MNKAAQLVFVLLFGMLAAIGVSNAASAAAAVVDGKPNFAAARDAGVYVWREGAAWRTRVISGSTQQNVMGGIAGTGPLTWVGLVSVEGNDGIKRPRPGQVDFDLKVNAGDLMDGVDFGIQPGGGVCFWVWGTLGKTVYLGANAAQATSPVDLLGNGACGNGGGSTPQPAPAPSNPSTPPPASAPVGKLKYNPGHYIAMNDWDTQADMIQAVKPGVRGIHMRYKWKDLEPSFGNYNFSRIASDLRLMADHGMQLVVMVEDKSFFSHIKSTPSYLWQDNTLPIKGGGHVSKRWAPYVITRMAALTQALGKQFDGHPNFEGIAFQESAMGLLDNVQRAHGYTPEKYRDALIQILRNTRNHFPRSQVFWYMNFIEGNNSYIGQVANAVAPQKIAMGGPDILPDDWSLNHHTYPYYRQFKDRMTLFGSVQYVGYNHLRTDRTTKYWTPPQLFAFARDRLHVNYLFWTRKIRPEPADSYDWNHALPVIRNNPNFNR